NAFQYQRAYCSTPPPRRSIEASRAATCGAQRVGAEKYRRRLLSDARESGMIRALARVVPSRFEQRQAVSGARPARLRARFGIQLPTAERANLAVACSLARIYKNPAAIAKS